MVQCRHDLHCNWNTGSRQEYDSVHSLALAISQYVRAQYIAEHHYIYIASLYIYVAEHHLFTTCVAVDHPLGLHRCTCHRCVQCFLLCCSVGSTARLSRRCLGSFGSRSLACFSLALLVFSPCRIGQSRYTRRKVGNTDACMTRSELFSLHPRAPRNSS